MSNTKSHARRLEFAKPPPSLGFAVTSDLQETCEQGQTALIETRYLDAERLFLAAESLAAEHEDFDTLGRLYFPLQEARRQRRQICGEGTVRLDLWATQEEDVNAADIVGRYPHGQLLVAGRASLAASLAVRQLAADQNLFVETYLAAAYPLTEDGRIVVAVVPTADVALPPQETALSLGVGGLLKRLPPFSLVLADDELPRGERSGSAATFAETMHLWEQLHLPFLNDAKQTRDPMRRLEQYRRTINVDYACEKAHQWLADTALEIARTSARSGKPDGTGIASRNA